ARSTPARLHWAAPPSRPESKSACAKSYREASGWMENRQRSSRMTDSLQHLEATRLGNSLRDLLMMRLHERRTAVERANAVGPSATTFVEFEVVVHQAAARHQDAKVRAFIEVVPRANDAQEEGAIVTLHSTAVRLHAHVLQAAILLHLVDAARRCLGHMLDFFAGVFDHQLAPIIDVVGIGPPQIERLD